MAEALEEARAGHILISPFNHRTHHRGRVHVMLTQAGAAPSPLNVIDYLEEIGEAGPRGTIGQ